MMIHRALIVEYDGTEFVGFQYQKDGRSIQGELERAIGIILRQPVKISGSGRTDSGVHATGQVVSFSLDSSLHTKSSEKVLNDDHRFLNGLNALLPADVAVRKIVHVPHWFHPRFSCIAREYEYLIWNHPARSAIWNGKALWIRSDIQVDSLHTELQGLVGEHDFASFTRAEYIQENTVRYIDHISLRRIPDPHSGSENLIRFRIRGNAFLHNMIRIIVGTILDRSMGKLDLSFGEILRAKSRFSAGRTVSPVGLYFRHAYYPSKLEGVDGLEILREYPIFTRRALGDG